MKLRCKHISLFHRCIDRYSIFRLCCHDTPVSSLQIIGMYKIHIRSFGYFVKQSSRMRIGKIVPSHVRNLAPFSFRNFQNTSLQNPQSRDPGCFLAAVEQKLQSDADAKKRNVL